MPDPPTDLVKYASMKELCRIGNQFFAIELPFLREDKPLSNNPPLGFALSALTIPYHNGERNLSEQERKNIACELAEKALKELRLETLAQPSKDTTQALIM
ncbi:hypothetical protein PMIN02_013052 [Paraphaeosphaeria minitans]